GTLPIRPYRARAAPPLCRRPDARDQRRSALQPTHGRPTAKTRRGLLLRPLINPASEPPRFHAELQCDVVLNRPWRTGGNLIGFSLAAMKVTCGPFTLDDDRRQLLDGTEPVHLSPKAYDVLRLLLQRRPSAVAKNDIHDVVWPGTFVTDVTMATVMSELRAALGDPADRSRFIRTVRGFGIRLRVRSSRCRSADRRRRALLGDVGRASSTATSRRQRVGSRTSRRVMAGLAVGIAPPRTHRSRQRRCDAHDLGSKNGTFLNGERLRCPTELVDGDEICMGTVTLVFR